MNLIYQIGRFDKNFNNPLKFKIKEKIYEKPLSSFALKEFLSSDKNDTAVILIYPISLLLNPQVKSWNLPTDFKEKLFKLLESPEEKENYLKNPTEYFKLHPHSKIADDFSIIHSIGEYNGIKFSATFDDIFLNILFDMLTRYLDALYSGTPISQVFIDISSGHNIYVSALIETTRYFLTFHKLRNWDEEYKLKVYLVFSDPILGQHKREYEIHTNYKFDVKAFFSIPIKIRRNEASFAKKLTNNNKEIKKKIQPFFEEACLFYSMIKNNAPLCLYTFSQHSLNQIDEIIKTIIEFGKNRLHESWRNSPQLSRLDFIKALFLLALYYGIVKILEKNKIFLKPEVSISEIKEKFTSKNNSIYFYFNLPLNRNYLSHEISNYFNEKAKFQSEWRLLREYLPGEKSDQIEHRNFIAHCGFERNCTEVKKEGNEIFVRYKKENKILERIEKILEDYI